MLLNRDEETIIAQCTPQGSGALALLRLSGVNARSIVANMASLPGKKSIIQVPTHTVHYGWVTDSYGTKIDQVLFIVMDGPKTFTGQDVIEITCHNNQFIIDAIIAQAIAYGARVAHGGEFTKRAFAHNKIDLLQAEAINELIHANTQLALKKSLAQLEGSFSHWMVAIEKELVRALAWCEASFEFLDEEEEFGVQIKKHIQELLTQLMQLKKTFDQQQQIRQGIRIALIGSVNAGKSSLFNALLNQKRSIVTPIAGTTRDVIESGVYRNGNYWTLADTAGLRQTTDSIEKEGIQRSFDEAHKADIIILVFDGSRVLTPEEHTIYTKLLSDYASKIILVHNKADLPEITDHALVPLRTLVLSAHTRQSLESLEQLIEDKIALLFHALESPFLLNQRQFTLVLGLEKKLHEIVAMLSVPFVQYELVSYHLKDALEHVSELTGKSVSEAGMDMVFKEFCVGK
ncbi:tRNA uridine-5-carboxymethylaminomethyl(34) synthesis GTPase MnmE [Candidatus Dependentiae bacterium]|nr:tRNA uridine-5-carboxymethylaminomethyl(34) synthesis GTPase MnmE [Candidatus Dependentiae bacterium]